MTALGMSQRVLVLCWCRLLAESVAEAGTKAGACPERPLATSAQDDASLSFLQTSLYLQSPPALPRERRLSHPFPAADSWRSESALLSWRALAVEDVPWWWTPLISMPLLILACLLLHRGLFRPWNWFWLAALPFSVAGIGLLATEGVGGSTDWASAVEASGVTVLLALMVLVRHAHTPEISIKPAGGWPEPGSFGVVSSVRKANKAIHAYCVHTLKQARWVFLLAYLGLGTSIMVVVIQDLIDQHYANACAGVFLAASIPVPNRLLYKYPLVHVRRWNMAQAQDAAPARDVGDSSDSVDEWYVAPMDGNEQTSNLGDFCCRLPWSWVLLYTSWYLCSEYSAYTDSAARVLALLLASLIDVFAQQIGQRRRGVASDPWQTQLWVQSRLVVTWSYLMFEGISNHFLGRHMTSEDWVVRSQEQQLIYIWGAGNAVWGLFHLAWFAKRILWFRRLEAARSTWRAAPAERRTPAAAA